MPERYGIERVVAFGVRISPAQLSGPDGVYEHLHCTQPQQIFELMRRQGQVIDRTLKTGVIGPPTSIRLPMQL
ncbi:hypothetical protein [Methylocapsa aurea]|uniref:hypothetical protein n=1 Tax=Methylocapsa aurea TaxID=663610 RepID=UPI000561CB72|nr:hypothetical protein [Methylocapsa aurea]